MKNIRIFILKFSFFLVVKFSIYLNRRVFVMQRAEVEEFTQHRWVKRICNVLQLGQIQIVMSNTCYGHSQCTLGTHNFTL